MKQQSTYSAKLVLHSRSGCQPELIPLIERFLNDGVRFVAVVGQDCERIEALIDDIVVGDGATDHFILTSSHAGEPLEAAVEFARSLVDEYAGEVQVVEF
jgi:hypothetical protein